MHLDHYFHHKQTKNKGNTRILFGIVFGTITAVLLLLYIFTIVTDNFPWISPNREAFGTHPHPGESELWTINSGDAPKTDNFKLPPGYKIEPIVWNLTLPGSVAFDDKGNMYIGEVGSSYGQFFATPRILKVNQQEQEQQQQEQQQQQSENNISSSSALIDRFLFEPITDIEFNKADGLLYVSHRAMISTVNTTNGQVKDIVLGLPTVDSGTHPQGQIVFGPNDGRVYFTTGTPTNSGVVDESDFTTGWLKVMPQMHDIPGQDIILTGQNFKSKNLLDPTDKSNVTTGAFVPFGTSTKEGQIIKGEKKNCTGCILSVKADGSDLRLHAWGLRNPYGMVFGNEGNNLFIANNGADDKGIRPITNDTDNLYILDTDKSSKNNNNNNITWYGWPDFYGNGEPVTNPKFPQSYKINQTNPNFLIKNHPPVTKPFVQLGHAIGHTQAAFSNNTDFVAGENGMIFIGEFGTISPVTHIRIGPTGEGGKIVGQKIIMVDPQTGNLTDFISLKRPDPNFRPVGLEFNPDGNALYIADFGKVEIRKITPQGAELPISVVWTYPNTGIIWKITKSSDGNDNIPPTSIASTTTNTAATPAAATSDYDYDDDKRTMTTAIRPIQQGIEQKEQVVQVPYYHHYQTVSTTNTAANLEEQSTTNTNTNTNTNDTSSIEETSKNVQIAIPRDAIYSKSGPYYMPTTTHVQPGANVTWHNGDIAVHTATSSDDSSFDTGPIEPGKSASATIPNKQGQFLYYCTIHPYMTATLNVAASGINLAQIAGNASTINTTTSNVTTTTTTPPTPTEQKKETALSQLGSVLKLYNANIPIDIPLSKGFVDGKEVFFITTDASDEKLAQNLTNQTGFKVNFAPLIAKAPDESVAHFYVFKNGIKGKGSLGFQPNVADSQPGDENYSPLWKIKIVQWNNNVAPTELKSETEIMDAITKGNLTVTETDLIVNCPFVKWDGGSMKIRDNKTITDDSKYGDGQVLNIDIEKMIATFVAHRGWGPDGKALYYIVTDATPEMPANMMGVPLVKKDEHLVSSPTSPLVAPDLFQFENGINGSGPMGFQAGIGGASPDDSNYSPMWRISSITWKDPSQARILETMGDIVSLQQAGLITVKPAMNGTNVVNCPFFDTETVFQHKSKVIQTTATTAAATTTAITPSDSTGGEPEPESPPERQEIPPSSISNQTGEAATTVQSQQNQLQQPLPTVKEDEREEDDDDDEEEDDDDDDDNKEEEEDDDDN